MDAMGVRLPASVRVAPGAPRDLESACRALEKEFAQLLFQKMREAMVPRDRKGSAGFSRDTAEAMLDAQWAELASGGEGLGLWRSLLRELQGPAVKSPEVQTDEGNRAEPLRPEERPGPAAGGGAGGARAPQRGWETDRG